MIINGINANKLISNPIHNPNHEFEEIVIIEPINTININKILDKFLNIKKERINLYI